MRALGRWCSAVTISLGVFTAGGTVVLAQEASPVAGPPPLPAGCTVVAEGLNNPRFVAVGEDGTLYISEAGAGGDEALQLGPPPGEEEVAEEVVGSPAAEVVEAEASPSSVQEEEPAGDQGPPPSRGGTGQVTMVAPDGTQSVLATGLPSYSFGVGPAGLLVADGQIWLAVGGAAGELGIEPLPNENSVVQIDPATGEVTLVAELGSYEVENNPDGEDINPNLYGIAFADGQLHVADAGGNTLYSVDPASGEFTVAVVPGLPALTGATPVPDQPAERQSVPTDVVVGADGLVHVALLSEFWPPDAPSILRVEADGTFTSVATGLSNAVGLAVDASGAVYASQLTADFTAQPPAPGSVLRIGPDGVGEIILDGLVFPHGIVFDQTGNLYVVHNSLAFGPGAPQGQLLRCEGATGSAQAAPVAIGAETAA